MNAIQQPKSFDGSTEGNTPRVASKRMNLARDHLPDHGNGRLVTGPRATAYNECNCWCMMHI